MALAAARGAFLLTDLTYVRNILMVRGRLAAAWVVVPFIQTEMLRRLGCGFRPLHDNGIERIRQQLGVVNICTGNDDGQRAAIGFDQNAALHAVFRTIRGVRTDIVPPKRALPMALSAACHLQSTPRSSSQRSIKVTHNRSSTPSRSQR